MASVLLDKLFAEVQRDCQETGRRDIWHVIEQRLLNPVTLGTPPVPFENIANELGLTTKQASNLMATAIRKIHRWLDRLLDEAVPPGEGESAKDRNMQRIGMRKAAGEAIRKYGVSLIEFRIDANLSQFTAISRNDASDVLAGIIGPDFATAWQDLISRPLGELIRFESEMPEASLTLRELWESGAPNEDVLKTTKNLGKRAAHGRLREDDPPIPDELGFAVYAMCIAVARSKLQQVIGKPEPAVALDTVLRFDWPDTITRALVADVRRQLTT